MRKSRCVLEVHRARILVLLSQGETASEVARMVGCVRATVYRTVYRYEDMGEESIRDRRRCREPSKVTAPVQEQLLAYLDDVPQDYGWERCNWTLELLSLQLAKDTGVQLSDRHVLRVLHHCGCRRGRPRPGLRIPVRGRRKVLENIKKLVADSSPDDEVFYQDEADVHLNPKMGATYMKPGQQLMVLTPGQNVKRYVFGALNTRTGRIVHGIAERKNAPTFVQFLEYLSRTYRRASKLHLVLDNYIIHKADAVHTWLDHHPRFRFLFQPVYHPWVNQIERLWKAMHDTVTRNHRHNSMFGLCQDVRRFFDVVQPFPGSSHGVAPF
jgi:transposase